MRTIKLKLNDKQLKILIIAGFVGIALIFISSIFGVKNEKGTNVKADKTIHETENELYESKLEKEIYELLSGIEGVGAAKVMITLSSGVEYIYATEDSINSDKTSDNEQTVAQRLQTSKKTILIEDENGRKKALLRKTLEPVVKGAVIVCKGGDDIVVKERVTEAVKAALGISSAKICVIKSV